MNITSAKYTKEETQENNSSIQTIIDGVNLDVPLDPANRHYQAILEWAKIDGNTIEEAD